VRIEDVKDQWEAIGSADPLWAVLSHDGKEHGSWDTEEFFQHGVRDVEQMMQQIELAGWTPALDDALDFGCGVGRLTRPLARHFASACGVDVSAPMLELAKRLTAPDENCRYILNTTESLPFAAGSFDLVTSFIVLQHLPKPLMTRYVREFIRVLRPGGVGVFQIPAEEMGGSTSANPVTRRAMNALPSELREEIHRRRRDPDVRDLPMHGLPRRKVLRLVERTGEARVVACLEDDRAGPNWRSYTYIIRRPD
jgi:SAM-dependent methyltransferase